jgi:hypothetical protein
VQAAGRSFIPPLCDPRLPPYSTYLTVYYHLPMVREGRLYVQYVGTVVVQLGRSVYLHCMHAAEGGVCGEDGNPKTKEEENLELN